MNTRHVNAVVYMGRSDKRTIKYMVVIGTKTVYFGTRGQLDYTKTHDVHAKQTYIAKHPGLSSATNKQMLNNPFFWERWILWNKPSKRESIRYLEHKLHIRIRPLPVRMSPHRHGVVGGATSRRSRRNTQKTAAAVITAAALATALAIKHNQNHAPVAAPVVQTERAAPVAPVIEAEAERIEAERVEAERVEAERVEAQEAVRVEAERAVRVEAERAVRVEAAQQLEETAHHEQQIINVVNNAREQYKQIHKAYDNANTELGKHSMCIDSTRRNLQYAQLLPSYSTTERYISAPGRCHSLYIDLNRLSRELCFC